MRRSLRSLGHSLRGRLLVGTVIWILIAVSIAGWALSDLFRQHIARQLASELAVHMNQLVAALSVDEQGSPTMAFDLSDPRLQQPYSGLYWQINRMSDDQPEGDVLFHSRSLWDQTLQLPLLSKDARQQGLVTLPGPDLSEMLALQRVVTPPEGRASYRLVIAVDRGSVDGPLQAFRALLAIFLGMLAIGLTVAAVMQVVVGLRPLVRLREQLVRVRNGNLASIEGSFPNEIQPLVDDFNTVLRSNNDIVERARTQAGNLAHALKTPLSVLSNSAAQEASVFGRLVSEQVSLASRQVEHHLARARATAAVRTPGKKTEVAPVIEGLARVLTRLYAERGVTLHIGSMPAGLVFLGEQQDLQEMMGNLMDNACKWANTRVMVTVAMMGPVAPDGKTARDRATTLVLRVDDDGPGQPQDRLDAIFQRGVRMDERKPGSGLGLAIVRDLATAYGGAVQARASWLGGLGIDLQLPAEQTASL